MLRKLLKYEVKATSMVFLFLYMAIIGFSIFNNIFEAVQLNWGMLVTGTILVALFVSLVVVTVVVAVQRFNRNLLGDEGYLMFTLPVNTKKLIASKLIVTLMWSATSSIIAVIAFIIILSHNIEWEYTLSELIRNFKDMWIQFDNELIREVHITANGFVIGISIGILVSYIELILVIYASLAIAQLPVFSKHKGISAFGAFFVFNVILNNVLSSILFHILGVNSTSPKMLIVGGIGITVLVDIIFFILIDQILSKHLNLE